MEEYAGIKYVALYLRKSRGESETDLVKHKTLLTDMCLNNGWTFVEYCEIQSGDSIAMRPVMQRLLVDVEEGMYDAVVVVDFDRLGRGDLGDQDRIKKAFQTSETLLIAEKSTYDLNNDRDEFMADIKGIFGRQEYVTIVKRFRRGKKIGSRLGNWTNGTPPFPYEYEQWKDKFRKQGLVVNDDKLLIYNLIKEMFLKELKTPRAIASHLNRLGILSPRGKHWPEMTIQRLMLDETHLGRIVSNKSKGDGHRVKKPSAKKYMTIPQDEWLRVENCHEAVKTLEEHEKIQALLFKRRLGVTRAVQPVHALSGLVRCGVCGRTMQFENRTGHGTVERLKRCWYRDPLGDKCVTRGGPVDVIKDAIEQQLARYEADIIAKIQSYKSETSQLALSKVAEFTKAIAQTEQQLAFVYEQYEKRVYSESDFTMRRSKVEDTLAELKKSLQGWRVQLKADQRVSNEDRLERVKLFRQQVVGVAEAVELNSLYRSIIESIEWTRQEDEIHFRINFR